MRFVAQYVDAWRRASVGVDVAAVNAVVDVLHDARARDATVWTLGNGGGSALAAHLAIGLTLNTRRAGGRPFRATCVGADAAALSAATNDFGAEDALRAILECNARAGDVLCAFSVSGESPNVNRAIAAAHELGVGVVAFVGAPGSTTARLADHSILLGSVEPGIAEDVASALMHAIYCTFMYEHLEQPPAGFADVE